ncbi:uncharacterized protein [Nicotiana sylvestris]|uniref:Uncharacterized protein LOC104235547 isoform X1 n=1 Tax=Nicotiana sylvestris TaxID=4096 RepID=A0A1U7XDA6_NICSY|nr:PREDICTED: uncharacterized protein LOC104235547 isoform X1 [Nicotiana sylvestris]
MGRGGRVEVVSSKGCSKLLVDFSSSFRGIPSYSLEPLIMSPASSASVMSESTVITRSNNPFYGLVICVTGLSKEARKQVMEATERLGGKYSPHLHPQCTHLVVQHSFSGRKFEHASKHGSKNGLLVVTLAWFVDSVRRNVRLSESLYSVKGVGQGGLSVDDIDGLVQRASRQHSCLPVALPENSKRADMIEEPLMHAEREPKRRTLLGHAFYVDGDVSDELRSKVIESAAAEGASLVDRWFVGCGASHVVCEGNSIQKYLGHSSNIVTPLWVLKSAKEKCLQRLVHMSADLARQTGALLDSIQNTINSKEINAGALLQDTTSSTPIVNQEERLNVVNVAKEGVRKRRGWRMQTCQTPLRHLSPNILLDSICWSISDPTSTASIYMDASSAEDAKQQNTSVFFDAKEDQKASDASFVNLSRPLSESEKSELILKTNFLNILFPVDRFSEMGPCSRTFFSEKGFTCLQVLDYIHAFYQENMSVAEVEIAIHTDSRHADRLRSVYCSKETSERGCVEFRRIEFLGSRKSFEMLKRVSGDNNCNVYELLIRA